ncbi:hypothetical protein BAL199_05084 [alpha proteobacterium BAL199]|nr:hypothetical protein BAL199_05084 [alpha proteobacterium BAL199]
MTDDPDHSARDPILDAALELAAEHGWRSVTATGLASRTDGDLKALGGCGPFRARLLGALADRTDRTMRDGLDDDARDTSLPVRDRLFEALMARLDALSEHRAGTLAILRGVPFDPPSALAAIPLLGRSMARTLQAVGESPLPPFGPLKVKGLSWVWLATLRVWAKDDSADMAVTMKALDTALARAEEAANSFLPGGRRRAAHSAPES